MIEKVIDIQVKDESVEKATLKVEDLQQAFVGALQESKKLDESQKKATKNTKSLGKSIKSMGVALKAAGIGLIVGAFVKMKEILGENQKVVDFFSTAFETLSIMVNDFVNFVIDNFGSVVDGFKSVFEDPLQSIKDLGQAIKDNLLERFYSAIEVLGFLGEAAKKFFEGDFAGAWESAKNAGEELVDVMTGVDNTLEKGKEILSEVTEAVVDYTTATVKQAKANVELVKSSELAEAINQRLIEQYDRAAEKQRQIRDEERNTIEDRIKANDELGRVLEEQEKKMLELADIRIQAANILKNEQERNVALQQALAEKEGILAQIEGFRSEQLVNDLALKREQIELNQSISDGEKERQLNQLEFEESQAKTNAEKLELQRTRLMLENDLIAQDIERKRELFLEGTQARVDAENEYALRKQQIDNQLKANEDAIENDKVTRDKILAQQKIALANQTLGAITEILGQNTAAGKAAAIASALINTYQGVTQVWKSDSVLKEPFATASKIVSTATVLASGLQAVKAIKSTKLPSFASGAGVGDAGGGISAPSFNVVGASGVNQLADTLNQDNEPIQAYVVANDVTTAQSLNNNIVESATLG